MNVPVVSHLKLLVNLYNKMNNRFLVLLVIYLIIYLLSVLYKNKQIFCAILITIMIVRASIRSGFLSRSRECCRTISKSSGFSLMNKSALVRLSLLLDGDGVVTVLIAFLNRDMRDGNYTAPLSHL